MNNGRNVRGVKNNTGAPRIVNYYSSGNMPSMSSIVFIILIVITIAVIFYYGYTIFSASPKQVEKDIITSAIDGKIQYNIPGSGLPTSQFSNEYSISMWLRVDDYSYRYGEKKVILRRGDGDSVNPEISLDERDNNLVVKLGLATQSSSSSGSVDKAVARFKNIEQMYLQQNADDSNKEFGCVSNNDVVPLNKMTYNIDTSDACYEGTSIMRGRDQVKYLLETFSNNPDLITAASGVMIAICNTFNAIEDPDTAKLMLQVLDDSLDQMDVNLSSADVQNKMNSSVAKYSGNPAINTINTQVQTIVSSLVKLADLKPSQQDIVDSLPAINDAITKAGCPLTMDANDITSTDKFNAALKKMINKMYYQVLYNLGVAVAQVHGDQIKMYDREMSGKLGKCTIHKFPLQRWTNVVLSVMNQNVNLYQDGRLVSSCVMPGFPQIQTGDIVLFPDGGVAGKLAKLMYSNMALNQDQINSIYETGPQTTGSFIDTFPNWLIYVGISLVSMLVVLMIVS